MRIIAIEHISLDGVLQAPARADEDTSGGFRFGGWSAPGIDESMGELMGERMGEGFSWLFGRRTYDDLLAHWNAAGGPYADGLNAATKYVASRDPDRDLPWPNSVLLSGDVPARIAELRDRDGGSLVIMGSGRLIHALTARGLIDEFVVMTHPVVLGSGTRLFADDGAGFRMRTVSTATTRTGVVLAVYERTEDPVA